MAQGANGAPITLSIPVVVAWPALSKVEIVSSSDLDLRRASPRRRSSPAGTPTAASGPGSPAAGAAPNAAVATVNRFGEVTGVAPGAVTITVEAEGVRTSRAFTVLPNPVAKVEIRCPSRRCAPGDVIHLKAAARRANGAEIAKYPITWSYTYVAGRLDRAGGDPGRARASCSSTASRRTIRAATP